MTLYELLGVDRYAPDKDIKSAYRRKSKELHPDNADTGDAEKFRQIQEAFEVLSDPDRRKRYDTTGRKTESPVNERSITEYVEGLIQACVEAEDSEGNTDDPVFQDINANVLRSIKLARRQIRDNRNKINRKLRRAHQLLRRYVPKSSGMKDYVGNALRKKVASLTDQVHKLDDALELSQAAEEVFKSYHYEVGPQAEGQDTQGPTSRRSGILFLS